MFLLQLYCDEWMSGLTQSPVKPQQFVYIFSFLQELDKSNVLSWLWSWFVLINCRWYSLLFLTQLG